MTRPSRLPPFQAGPSPDDPQVWTNVLADVPLFAGLNARHRKKVAALGRIRRFHEGATIMRAGEAGTALYVVLDGEVSVRPPGRRSVRLGIGSFVGELALLDDGPRSADVVATTPLVVLSIGRPQFEKLLRAEPQIALMVARELATRLRSVTTP